MIVTVQPLFEYKYICLKGLNSTINIDGYTVKFNVSDYCVVPYGALGDTSVTYQQTDKYYIKDISFAGTLYNQQYLNVGDPGYDALENYGSYFTAFDYEYSGKTREDGIFPTDELLTLSLDAFGIAMGIVAKVSTTGSVIGMTAKTLGSVLNISLIAKEVIDFGQGITNWANGTTVDKKVTTQCYYQNRNDQLEHYKDEDGRPALTKTAAITCNTPDDQSIWYGVGDYARAYFYVGHGGTADIETYYTRFTDNIALKIMDFDTDEVVEIGTGLSRASLREPEYKVPFMDTETNFYMLPEGEEHFSFAAEYESDYKVSLSLSSEADIVINGKQYHNKVLTVNQYVESGKELIIDMLGNEAGLNGTITISPNSTGKATSISSNGKYLFKATLSQVKELRTSNSQVLIDTIYTLKEGELYLYR